MGQGKKVTPGNNGFIVLALSPRDKPGDKKKSVERKLGDNSPGRAHTLLCEVLVPAWPCTLRNMEKGA